jgi:hypothetical protein
VDCHFVLIRESSGEPLVVDAGEVRVGSLSGPLAGEKARAELGQRPAGVVRHVGQAFTDDSARANMRSPMTSQGRPLTRMRRAIQNGLVEMALDNARELRHIGLDDALALCLLLRGDRRYDAAARRWVSRLATEARVTLAEVAEAAVALHVLADPIADDSAPLGTLTAILERRGLRLVATPPRRRPAA